MSTASKLHQQQPAAWSAPSGPASPSVRFLRAPEFDHVSHFKVMP